MVRSTRQRQGALGATVTKPPRGAHHDERGAERDATITTSLLQWYAANRRQLPWRVGGNPYAVWISEIMLQQTQVSSVIAYFERWMQRFPTVEALATAAEDDVLAAWQGLGYYSRARNLQRAARIIVADHHGRVPRSVQLLRQLPGIGRYTAGAISSIAFDEPEPAVDGNVTRVLTRVEALRGDPRIAPTAAQIWQTAAAWVTTASPSRLNQALMELGALVCTPRQPRCGHCPIVSACRAHQAELVDQLPELPARPKPETRHVAVVLSESRGRLLVVRQPEIAAHWAGLFVLPYVEFPITRRAQLAVRELIDRLDPKAVLLHTQPVAALRYPITRFRFQASAFLTSKLRPSRVSLLGGRYATSTELDALALPAPHRRLIQMWRNRE